MIKGTTSDPKFPPKYGAVQVLFFWTNDWSSKGCHGIDWHLIVFCLTKQQNPRVQKAVFFMHCQVSESLWRQWIKDKKAQLTPSSLSWKNTDDDDVSTKMSFQTTDNILRWGFLELIIFIDKTNSSTTINDRPDINEKVKSQSRKIQRQYLRHYRILWYSFLSKRSKLNAHLIKKGINVKKVSLQHDIMINIHIYMINGYPESWGLNNHLFIYYYYAYFTEEKRKKILDWPMMWWLYDDILDKGLWLSFFKPFL